MRWEIRYNDAGRHSPYRKRRFERKEDAQTVLDEMRRRRRLGDLAEAEWSRRPVRELALDWWALYVLPNLSPRTRNDYRKLLDRHLIPRLGTHRLRDVTVAVVDDFRAKLLAAGVGDSQTRQALAVLSGMFTYAERRDRVSRNPVRLVKKPSARRRRAVVCLAPLTVEVARALLLEDERYGDAALVSRSPTLARGPRRRSRSSGDTSASGRCCLSRRTSTARSSPAKRPAARRAPPRCGLRCGMTFWPGNCTQGGEAGWCFPTTAGSRSATPTGATGPSSGGARPQPAHDADHLHARDQ